MSKTHRRKFITRGKGISANSSRGRLLPICSIIKSYVKSEGKLAARRANAKSDPSSPALSLPEEGTALGKGDKSKIFHHPSLSKPFIISLYRRILGLLWRDVEKKVISVQDFISIARELNKNLYP